MNFPEHHDCLIRIAQFIRQEKTGTPKELAERCGIDCEKTLLRQIEILRLFAARDFAEILYDRNRKTYYFNPPGKFTDFKFKEDVW